jgi:hypothetical protein
MPFLALCGWEIPIADGQASQIEAGGRGRSVSLWGTPRAAQRLSVRRWDLTSRILSQEDADALQELLGGIGHVLPFDTGLDASTGLAPERGYRAKLLPSSGAFAGAVEVLASGTLVYDAQLGDRWTVTLWTYEGGAWVPYTVRDDGAKWASGVRNDTATTSWLSVASGALTLSPGGAARRFDDLTILPWRSSAAQIAAHHARTAGFPRLPLLELTGDLVPDAAVTVSAELEEQEGVQAQLEDGWEAGARRVSFTLTEVLPEA